MQSNPSFQLSFQMAAPPPPRAPTGPDGKQLVKIHIYSNFVLTVGCLTASTIAKSFDDQRWEKQLRDIHVDLNSSLPLSFQMAAPPPPRTPTPLTIEDGKQPVEIPPHLDSSRSEKALKVGPPPPVPKTMNAIVGKTEIRFFKTVYIASSAFPSFHLSV